MKDYIGPPRKGGMGKVVVRDRQEEIVYILGYLEGYEEALKTRKKNKGKDVLPHKEGK